VIEAADPDAPYGIGPGFLDSTPPAIVAK
jgi:hypothetical protein